MMLRQAQTSEPRALPRFAPARPRTASRANPPFVRNLPPHARANAWFYWENLHRYGDPASSGSVVANDPVNLIDYTGKKIEVAMHEVTVGPYNSGSYHLKIVIVPNDQDAFRNDGRFQVDGNGTVFATIGAGPDTGMNVFGTLVEGMNRETDVGKLLSGESYTVGSITPGRGDTENNLINRMIGVAESFDDSKYDYSLSPSANGSDYNSNSFVGGLINRLDGDSSQLNPSMPTPGLEKPVPPEAFCQPSTNGCR